MAITLPTVLVQGNSVTVASSQATGSFTMPVGGLVLACWSIHTAGTLSNPTLTDNVGGTWVNYTDGSAVANSVIVAGSSRAKVFRCAVFGTGTATLTLDCAGVNHDGWTWHILHFPDAANQNATQIVNTTGTDNAPIANLAAMQGASGTFGYVGSSTGTLAVGAGFTASGVAQSPAVALRSMAECQTGNDTSVDFVATATPTWRMFGIEISPTSTGGLGVGLGSRRSAMPRLRRPAATWGGSHG